MTPTFWRVSNALTWHSDGLDFADALHLLASSHCTEFMTFDDRRFARRAKRLGLMPGVAVPLNSADGDRAWQD